MSNRKNRWHRFGANCEGSSATEFALIMPMMCVMLFGFFEVGRMFWTYHIVSNAVRDASRYAARLSTVCDSGGNAAFSDSSYSDRVKNLARTGTIDGTGAPLVSNWTNNNSVVITLSCIPNAGVYSGRYENYAQVPTVSVRATAPFSGLVPQLFTGLALASVTVHNSEAYTE
jgi:Flp pilus assembly protein TadG